jgi:hypothetical protein
MYSFNGVADSAATVEQIYAAFAREDYWLARLAAGDVPTTLDSLVVRPDGSVAVQVTQHLGRQLLPGRVSKLLPGDLTMECSETWAPDGDGRVCGQVGVVVSGGLGSCSAAAWLTRTGDGSRLGYDGTVHVRIPLVGGGLEKTIGTDLAENLPSVLEFTTTWIAERP